MAWETFWLLFATRGGGAWASMTWATTSFFVHNATMGRPELSRESGLHTACLLAKLVYFCIVTLVDFSLLLFYWPAAQLLGGETVAATFSKNPRSRVPSLPSGTRTPSLLSRVFVGCVHRSSVSQSQFRQQLALSRFRRRKEGPMNKLRDRSAEPHRPRFYTAPQRKHHNKDFITKKKKKPTLSFVNRTMYFHGAQTNPTRSDPTRKNP